MHHLSFTTIMQPHSMMKGTRRLFVRLLLAAVVILQFFASGRSFFAQRPVFSDSEVAVVSEIPQPQQKHPQARRAAEVALHVFILVSLIATMAFWSKVEYQWHQDDRATS